MTDVIAPPDTTTYREAIREAMCEAMRQDDRVFLMGDAVTAAIDGQKVPDGYYHLDRMVTSLVRHNADVGCCGTCLDARGIDDAQLVDGAVRSSMDQVADWTLDADRILTF